MPDLSEIRDQIDVIDREIVERYQKRMALVREVAAYKIETGKKVLDTSREDEKLETLGNLADNAFDHHAVQELFAQFMAISRKMQYGMLLDAGKMPEYSYEFTDDLFGEAKRVVFQGVEGAYGHITATRLFPEADRYPVPRFEDVCREVTGGKADFGVLPIDNSSAGMVGDVYDLLVRYPNVICAMYDLKVEHALLGLPGTKKDQIQTVYSHPQALMQCAGFLDRHPEWSRDALENTAVSAKKVHEDGDRSQGAIASPEAARLFGLDILEYPVNDNQKNTTRFIVIRRDPIFERKADKLSISFEVRHESGTLYKILSHCMFNDLNMNKIESRPIPDKPFEYRFYVDIEGNPESPGVKNALAGIAAEALSLQVLGSYRNLTKEEKEG